MTKNSAKRANPTGTFTAADLSGKTFRLRPIYKGGVVPQSLERLDHVFDPTRETRTHSPLHVGRIRAKKAFNAVAHDKASTSIWAVVKRPMSDVYYMPAEFEQFGEFAQKVINYEHSRTPAAFSRGVLLYIRQGTNTDSPWHYDTHAIDTTTSYHHVCANMLPTQHTVLHFTPEQRAAVEFDGTFSALYDLTDFKALRETPDAFDILSGSPYDITRHSSSCLHKGTTATESRNRTFACLSYFEFEDEHLYEAYPTPGIEHLKRTLSTPAGGAEEIGLNRYIRRYGIPTPPRI